MPNRLATSSSPYLLLHADDPIDWREWGPEALAEAADRDVPLLVSVGYAACHWCHVMRDESFSDPAVAAVVNPGFVAIKVDREERPDIDAVLMRATQALTGSGGWPMTVFCTPRGLPFFAGTYYPPQRSGGMPSFTEVVSAIAEAWAQRRDEVVGSADQIVAALAEPGPQAVGRPDAAAAVERVAADYDPIHGGFGTQPKFPPALVVDALLVKGDPAQLDLAVGTLTGMARGGIHDQVGGGFHRYSTDAGWAVPHFEKMLYDNALLLGTYARAWRRVPDHDPSTRDLYADVCDRTVAWLERELLLETGGFASSLDADSCDIRGAVHEGIYYVWNPELLTDALGEQDADWACRTFHVTQAGTFEHGLSVPQLIGRIDWPRLTSVRERLLKVRDGRFRPNRDDKIVAAWNGWLIDSLVQAAGIFGRAHWLDLARGAAQAVWSLQWVDGRLRRTSRLGVAGDAPGLAEDYGAVALGFARLAGATGEAVWLDRAREVLTAALDLFDAGDGGFADTARDAEALFTRPRDLTDNVTPSGTSALVAALRLVATIGEDPALAARADAASATMWPAIEAAPRFAGSALADLLIADEAAAGLTPAQVVVVDPAGDPVGDLARAAWRMAPSGSGIVVGRPNTAGFGDLFDGRDVSVATAFVCRGTVCFAPATTVGVLRSDLWRRV